MTFRNIADLKNGAAVFMDFTNRILIERGVDVSVRTEEEAAEVLARIASENRFTLYEYFITDKVGHEQDMTRAKEVLTSLARFIRDLLVRRDGAADAAANRLVGAALVVELHRHVACGAGTKGVPVASPARPVGGRGVALQGLPLDGGVARRGRGVLVAS